MCRRPDYRLFGGRRRCLHHWPISTNRATLQVHARIVKQTAESIASCLIPAVPTSRGGGVRGAGELQEPVQADLAGYVRAL